jgi:DeoR family glycerol-3-phosphate regulon repressor
MRPHERQEKILELLRDNGRVKVDALAEMLNISPETIRRDLTNLASEGLLWKVHGGASLPQPNGEGPFQIRMTERLREKRAIARAAAGLFHPGDTLFVDTGSATVLFAEELSRQSGLTVITNSVMIAQIMTRSRNGHRAFLIGGEYSDEAMENLGALAVRQVSQYHAVHAVITVSSLDVDGAMDYALEEAEIARTMIDQARSLTVIADSTKFQKMGLFRVCRLDELDCLVTEALPNDALTEALDKAGVDVHIAPVLQ